MIKKLSNQEFRKLYRNLYLIISALNLIDCKKVTVELVETYLDQLRRKVLYEMKFSLDLYEKDVELERTTGIKKLQMSIPKGNIELLLTLN